MTARGIDDHRPREQMQEAEVGAGRKTASGCVIGTEKRANTVLDGAGRDLVSGFL